MKIVYLIILFSLQFYAQGNFLIFTGRGIPDTAYSIDFNGTDEWFEVETPANLGIGYGQFTVHMWANLDIFVTAKQIMGNTTSLTIPGVSERGWSWEWLNNPGIGTYFQFNLRDSTAVTKSFDGGLDPEYYAGWHHYAMSMDSINDFMGFYVNGSLIFSRTISSLNLTKPIEIINLPEFFVGIANGGAFLGEIGSFQIINDALTQNEILFLYQMSKLTGGFPDNPNTVLHMEFSGDTNAEIFIDLSGNHTFTRTNIDSLDRTIYPNGYR